MPRDLRERGDSQRQEQFLEEAYSERRILKGGDGIAWDHIDGVVENVRRTYVKVVNVFLMPKDGSPGSDKQSL